MTNPNSKELIALSLFYNRFYDLFDEITNDKFLEIEPTLRFYKLREAFSIYKELLAYSPIKEYVEWMKKGGRPALEGIIVDELFSFIRNLLLHFPVFETWDEVYINKSLATWSKVGQIDKFLKKGLTIKIDGKNELKYRIWDTDKKEMTYFSVRFPEQYNESNIYHKNIIPEKVGMKFCMALMRKILDKQVENPVEEKFIIMSQVYFPLKKMDN
jgi:hypothetical protein